MKTTQTTDSAALTDTTLTGGRFTSRNAMRRPRRRKISTKQAIPDAVVSFLEGINATAVFDEPEFNPMDLPEWPGLFSKIDG